LYIEFVRFLKKTPIERKVIEQGMFVKHCKVEVYLLEIKMCENSNLEKIINKSMSRADTIGKALLIVFVHVTYMYLWVHIVNDYSRLIAPLHT
jgi:hypothetical protein